MSVERLLLMARYVIYQLLRSVHMNKNSVFLEEQSSCALHSNRQDRFKTRVCAMQQPSVLLNCCKSTTASRSNTAFIRKAIFVYTSLSRTSKLLSPTLGNFIYESLTDSCPMTRQACQSTYSQRARDTYPVSRKQFTNLIMT